MATLHIEHAISDLPTWLRAFSGFEAARRRAGVRGERILQPIDDDKYIYVELDFDNVDQAAAFREFLETNVWTSRKASPALTGTPRARVLTKVDAGRSLPSP